MTGKLVNVSPELLRVVRDEWTAVGTATGPAAVYAWHGIRVPRRVITGELTGADWLTEERSQVRHAIAERMGYRWMLANVPAERLDTDSRGTLWRPSRTLPTGSAGAARTTDRSGRTPTGCLRRRRRRQAPARGGGGTRRLP